MSSSSPARRSSAGGVGPGLIAGLPSASAPLELAWLLAEESTGELFGRYLTGAGG